jgi:hypothetical protein
MFGLRRLVPAFEGSLAEGLATVCTIVHPRPRAFFGI